FRHDLAAGSAGCAGRVVPIRYGDGADFAAGAALADGAEQRVALGATAEAVRDVFHVAAGNDGAVVEEQGRTYVELRIRCVGMARRFESRLAQAVEEFRIQTGHSSMRLMDARVRGKRDGGHAAVTISGWSSSAAAGSPSAGTR